MFTKDICKAHKENLDIVREMRVMNGMITAGLGAISQFWAGYFSFMFMGANTPEQLEGMADAVDDDAGEESFFDAKMVADISQAMDTERDSNMSYMYRAAARKHYELASWAKILFLCLSQPKEQAKYLESAHQANDFLNELRDEKVVMLKLLTTRLANIKSLSTRDEFRAKLDEKSDGMLGGLIMAIADFIMRHEYNDEHFGVVGISLDELTAGGLSEAEAQEFIELFSRVDNLEDIQRVEQAKKEGKMAEFARAFLKERHNGH